MHLKNKMDNLVAEIIHSTVDKKPISSLYFDKFEICVIEV
jgi:hypothetical protein